MRRILVRIYLVSAYKTRPCLASSRGRQLWPVSHSASVWFSRLTVKKLNRARCAVTSPSGSVIFSVPSPSTPFLSCAKTRHHLRLLDHSRVLTISGDTTSIPFPPFIYCIELAGRLTRVCVYLEYRPDRSRRNHMQARRNVGR